MCSTSCVRSGAKFVSNSLDRFLLSQGFLIMLEFLLGEMLRDQ